jgi:hypothetical protein
VVTTKTRRGALIGIPAARIDWERPPLWAAPQHENSEVDLVLAPVVLQPAPSQRNLAPLPIQSDDPWLRNPSY